MTIFFNILASDSTHPLTSALAHVPFYDTIVPYMLTLSNKSQILNELLGLFLKNPSAELYVRVIQRLLGRPVGSVQRHLTRLEGEGILISKAKGPLKYFSLNPDYPYLPELRTVVLSEMRRKALEHDLNKMLKKIKKHYRPEKIILYGSLAKGRVSPDGDIDLLIVKKDVPKRYWDRIKELAPLLKDCDAGIDIVVWTPEELAFEINKNLFLKEEILKKGKVLYEQAA